MLNEYTWTKMRIVKRGWKIGSNGRNLHWYNVIKDGDSETTPIHWVKVDEWRCTDILYIDQDPEIKDAQLKELERWSEYKFFEDEPKGNQSFRITQKYSDGKRT